MVKLEFNVDNKEEIVVNIINDLPSVKKCLKKYLKNLFKFNLVADEELFSNDEALFNKIDQLYLLIESICYNKKCIYFLQYTFDLISGHSIIREIFLKQEYRQTKLRQRLIQLFCLLCSNCLDYCKDTENFVDLILSTYDATLSIEDQSLLRLLSLLETSDFNLHRYRPFIWGINGAQFYAAKHAEKLAFLKWPTVDEIFKGFNGNILTNTLSSFPIHIQMTGGIVEIIEDFNSSKIYDPRFILPMFYHFLSSESIVKCHKFINYGGLSYSIAALSSTCKCTRSVAYRVLSRLYYHLNNVNYPQDRQLWICLIDQIRSGLTESDQQINLIHTIFFVRIIDVLLNPISKLFPTIRNYLINSQQKSFNYKKMPLLYDNCMHNLLATNVKTYALHQKFAINWVKDSLRTATDVKICHRHNIFSDMLLLYNSPLCAPANKTMIMKLLITLAQTFEGIKVLCFDCAIIAWLKHQSLIVSLIDNNQTTPPESIYNLLVAIWDTAFQDYNEKSIKPPYIFYPTFCYELIDVLYPIVHTNGKNPFVEMNQKCLHKFLFICEQSLCSGVGDEYHSIIKTKIFANSALHLDFIADYVESQCLE